MKKLFTTAFLMASLFVVGTLADDGGVVYRDGGVVYRDGSTYEDGYKNGYTDGGVVYLDAIVAAFDGGVVY